MTGDLEKSELDKLKAFPAVLVDGRRRVIRTVFEMRQANPSEEAGYGSQWGTEFKQLQDHIEAVDRAIEDEKKLEGTLGQL